MLNIHIVVQPPELLSSIKSKILFPLLTPHFLPLPALTATFYFLSHYNGASVHLYRWGEFLVITIWLHFLVGISGWADYTEAQNEGV